MRRCATPKRCCSSVTTRPKFWNATPSESNACVPITRRISPDWSCSASFFFLPAAREPVNSAMGMPVGARIAGEGRIVLPREDFRGRHQRGLHAIFDHIVAQRSGHGGLAGAHVPCTQAVHRAAAHHVRHCLPYSAFLRICGCEGQEAVEFFGAVLCQAQGAFSAFPAFSCAEAPIEAPAVPQRSYGGVRFEGRPSCGESGPSPRHPGAAKAVAAFAAVPGWGRADPAGGAKTHF